MLGLKLNHVSKRGYWQQSKEACSRSRCMHMCCILLCFVPNLTHVYQDYYIVTGTTVVPVSVKWPRRIGDNKSHHLVVVWPPDLTHFLQDYHTSTTGATLKEYLHVRRYVSYCDWWLSWQRLEGFNDSLQILLDCHTETCFSMCSL